ncbi:MAG: M48 family metallopeptidase [Blastocatellia bacterium]|nr:M48 family metallopeptidase [Blastocatellia bacterium]
MSQRRRFPKIAPSAFQHPMDTKALEALKRVKGVDFVVRKVNEFGFERYLYINNIADNVQVNRHQCPKLYDMLLEACEIIDVDVPQLYINQDPAVNAFTFGTESPFIVLNSGLIDLMEDDELFTIIAHEVGHIKCGHVLYKMVAHFLRFAAEIIGDMTFGIGKLLTGPILIAFYEWDRKSELSADRASLVGVQNPDTVIKSLMKLAGGCHKVYQQFNKDEFLRQADSYKELDESSLNQLYKFMQVVFRSHPFPALRAKEINEWSLSTEYRNIMDGIYPRLDIDYYGGRGDYQAPAPPATRGTVSCPNCGIKVEPDAKFCHVCGATIVGAIAIIEKNNKPSPPPKKDNRPRCRNCEAVLKASDDYCPSCGFNTRFDF